MLNMKIKRLIKPGPARLILLAALLGIFGPIATAMAFKVIKNVNSGEPVVDKIVIFEKGKTEGLTFKDDANCKMEIVDGSIECKIIGNEAIAPKIYWTPNGDLKATFDPRKYNFLILTCRLEGNTKQTNPTGKISELRPDNLWFVATLFNEKNERAGLANLADVSENTRTPDKTETLKIPMVLLTQSPNDVTSIQAVGFMWSAAHANQYRDFKLVIDKISLAD